MISGPTILIVDDNPDAQSGLELSFGDAARASTRHPEELEERDLEKAHLILVDFRLERWKSRDEAPELALRPMNGTALAAIIRAFLVENKTRPTALALHSAHLDDLSGDLPPEPREHAIARTNNLEWAFSKVGGSRTPPLHIRCLSLADAVRNLPATWPTDDRSQTDTLVRKLLGLNKGMQWFNHAWETVLECHPPVTELSSATHGVAFLRWLLHRILPYPCFLSDSARVAARLRVDIEPMLAALKNGERLWEDLGPYRYTGILSEFLGPVWWAAGVEHFLWEKTDGRILDLGALEDVVTGYGLSPINMSAQPVVAVDANYQPVASLVDPQSAVRVQPDDWPPYAEAAWTTVELAASHPLLKAIVLKEDLPKLGIP
jgi:hypothetical protein